MCLANVSAAHTRVHVMPPPPGSAFKASQLQGAPVWQLCVSAVGPTRLPAVCRSTLQVLHQRQPGAIAPGMSEQLVVQCVAAGELSQHSDAIRVHTQVRMPSPPPCTLLLAVPRHSCPLLHVQAGNLLIPLHASPGGSTAEAPLLPRRLDFGDVPLGEAATQALQLDCQQLPVDCPFDVSISKHNRHFAVSPLHACVLAGGGGARISVTFTPTRLATEQLQLEVLAPALCDAPLAVTVTGRAVPGLVRKRLLGTAAAAAVAIAPSAPDSCQQAAANASVSVSSSGKAGEVG